MQNRNYYWNTQGSTRWVFLTKKYALKFPSFYSWEMFLYGLLGNLHEIEFSSITSIKDRLAPIVFKLPLGLLTVQPRAKILSSAQFNNRKKECVQLRKYKEGEVDFVIPCELKADSFGIINDRLIIVDFGG